MNSGIICYIFYTPVMLLCIIVTAMLFFRLRVTRSVVSLALLNILGILWLFFGVIENMLKNQPNSLTGVKLTLLPVFLMPSFVLIFIIFHTEIFKIKEPIKVYFLFLPSLALWCPVLSSKYHNLIFANPSNYNSTYPKFGMFFYINFVLSAIYILGSVVITIIKSKREKTKTKYLLLVGSIMAPYLASVIPHILTEANIITPPFDLTPLFFSVFVFIISIIIHYYNLFEFMPYGKDFFNQTNEAAIIVDDNDNIIGFNKSASLLFGECYNKKKVDFFFYSIGLKNSSGESFALNTLGNIHYDTSYFNLTNQSSLHYNLNINTISQKKIKIMTFYDITDYYYIQEKINERKHVDEISDIGSELHDEVCNELFMVQQTLDNIMIKIEKQLPIDFNEYDLLLKRLMDIYSRLRRYANCLRANKHITEALDTFIEHSDNESIDLIHCIHLTIEKVRTYGIDMKVKFTHENIDVLLMAVSVCRNISFIIKESIVNSIKHSKAKQLEVALSYLNDGIYITLKDDSKDTSISGSQKLKSIEHRVNLLKGRINYLPGIRFGFGIHIPNN